ncbi:hypothetical protein [Parasphingorhabdus pacifica]
MSGLPQRPDTGGSAECPPPEPLPKHSPARCALIALLCPALLVVGCGSAPEDTEPDRSVRQYFADNNAAAARGPEAQQEFFDRSQHPDFSGHVCELGELTVELEPALTTLRPDPDFDPAGTGPPRGELWVVGVEVTTRRSGTVLGRQIGSVHLAFLQERVFGFAPCPR